MVLCRRSTNQLPYRTLVLSSQSQANICAKASASAKTKVVPKAEVKL